ncbi:MAG TPA: hypothetical protein VMI56_08875 [Reyranella sp.]|nr:hypothetical protein [Reyranella sp.]
MNAEGAKTLDSWRAILAFSAVAVILQVLLGGVRPVDGGVLAALARDGFHAQLSPFSQYLFDSPLKIIFLRGIGISSPVGLTLLFVFLSVLPFLAALLADDRETRRTAFLLLAALPLARISLGWLGTGDSVLFAGTVAIIVSQRPAVIAGAAVVLVSWHFQQGVILVALMGGTILVSGDGGQRAKLVPLAAGLATGMLLYGAAKLWLLPSYQGRTGFLLQYIDRFALRILFYWPAALAIGLPGMLALWLAKGFRGIHWSAYGCFVAAFVASTVTSDVSRVYFALSFPAVLYGLLVYKPVPLAELRRVGLLVPVLILSAAVPLLSWSGVEIYDWKGLVGVMTKYWGSSSWLKLFLDLAGAF